MNQLPFYELRGVRFKFKEKSNFGFGGVFDKKNDSSLTNLRKEFELGPIDLDIPEGRFTAIVGRSGSGKTTLLSLLGLLRQEDEGEILIRVEDETGRSTKSLWLDTNALELFRAKQIGFALQRGELIPYLSLLENAMIVNNFLGKDRAAAKERIMKLAEELYREEAEQHLLEAVINNKPANVSQGQYQRGAIVRALANNPVVILADEPTGNLDEHAGDIAMKTLSNVVNFKREDNQGKTSVIVVTHDIKLALTYADHIVVLKNGKIVGQCIKTDESHWKISDEYFQDKETVQGAILKML